MTQYAIYKTHQVAYTDLGSGSPIIFLHGFCEDKNIWANYQMQFINSGYRVITVDLPGFGQSSVIEGVSIETMANAVYAVVEQVLSNQKIVLIGHSMGGYVTLAFAEQYPQALAGIGMFHTHPFADSDTKKKNRQRSVAIIRKMGADKFVTQFVPGLFSETFRKEKPEVIDSVLKISANQSIDGIIAAQLAMKERPDRSQVLQIITVPVLIIIGQKDTTIGYELSIAQTHLPKIALIKLYEKIGHMGMFEAESETKEAILEFMEFLEGKG